MAGIQFEHIEPYIDGNGDTGRSSRLKLQRNFEKIKAWIDAMGVDLVTRYLSRLDDDTAAGLITFLKGLKLGNGGLYGLEATGDGQLRDLVVRALEILGDATVGGTLTTHDLTVTGTARFFELLIDEIRHVGGTVVLSQARMKTDLVMLPTEGIHQQGTSGLIEWVPSTDIEGHVYPSGMEGHVRLLWLADDGSRRTGNQFCRGDQVLLQQSHMLEAGGTDAANKYWWKLVIGASETPIDVVGADGTTRSYHWIEVDASSGLGTMVANAGDEVVALGWDATVGGVVTETEREIRQSAIILASGFTPDTWNDVKAPCFAEYAGIDSFTLEGKLVSIISPHGNDIAGDFRSKSGKNYEEIVNNLSDGMSEHSIWFGSGQPTLDNAPANEWVTTDVRKAHVGDLYFDTDEEPASEGGASWRFRAKNNNTVFAWERADDRYTVAALTKIQNVASDGIITGGMEKQGVLVRWNKAKADYLSAMSVAGRMGLTEDEAYLKLVKAWQLLYRYLNHAPSDDTTSNPPYELVHTDVSWTLPDEVIEYIYQVPAGAAGWKFVWKTFDDALAAMLDRNGLAVEAAIENNGDSIKAWVRENYTDSQSMLELLNGYAALTVQKKDLTQSGIELDLNGMKLTGKEILTQTPPSEPDTEPVKGFRFIGSLGEVYNPVTGRVQMRFGYDENTGFMTLSYYDNAGNKLYDLGPEGLMRNVTRNLSLLVQMFYQLLDGYGGVSSNARYGREYVEKGDASAIQAHLVYALLRGNIRAAAETKYGRVYFPQVGGVYQGIQAGNTRNITITEDGESSEEEWTPHEGYNTVHEMTHDGEYFVMPVDVNGKIIVSDLSFSHPSSDHTDGVFAEPEKVYTGTSNPSDYSDVRYWENILNVSAGDIANYQSVDWNNTVYVRRLVFLLHGRVMGEYNAYYNKTT